MNLTIKAVAGLVLPVDKNDVIHFDDQLPGFGYRLRRRSSSGPVRGTWIAQYRHAGATRRVKLGDAGVLNVEAARSAARKVLAQVALGQDPQGERADRRDKDRLSFRAVVAEYLEAKQPDVRASTLAPIRRYLTGRYFRPLHGKPVDGITRGDIAARLVVIVREHGSMSARQARAALNAFFVWALQMGLIENNPVIGAVKPKDNASRERALSEAELAAVWRANGDDDYGRVVKLLILCAGRRQEIGGIRFSELDAERGTWTLPGERSKNGRPHTLPLPPAAWDIINSVPRRASRDQLFGDRAARGFSAWAQGKAGLDRRLGDAVAPFQLHDIRRTVATGLAEYRHHAARHRANLEPPIRPQARASWDLQSIKLRARGEGGLGVMGRSYPQHRRWRRAQNHLVATRCQYYMTTCVGEMLNSEHRQNPEEVKK